MRDEITLINEALLHRSFTVNQYISIMNLKYAKLLFAFCQGGAIGAIGVSLSELGRTNTKSVVAFLFTGVGLLVAAVMIFKKYKMGDTLNPRITNPKVISVLTKYPLLPLYVASVVGIGIVVVINRFL